MNLTSRAHVLSYMGGQSATALNQLIDELIPRASGSVMKFTSRDFQRITHTLAYLDGQGGQVMMMPDTPIIDVSAVQIGNIVVPESADGVQAGYQYSEDALYLFGGYIFPLGYRNVRASYVAGFAGEETDYIPASSPYTLEPTTGGNDGAWAATDRGVVNATSGVAFTRVGSAPTTGQYAFSEGVYTFAAADANVRVTMSYDYVPGPVEQSTIELVLFIIRQRDNLGVQSKSLRDETISFEKDGLPLSVEEKLWPYRKVLPI